MSCLGLHALGSRRKIWNDGAHTSLKVSAFERFVVDTIVNASDLALDRGEPIVEFLDCLGELHFFNHVILDEIDRLKDVFRVSAHAGSVPQWSVARGNGGFPQKTAHGNWMSSAWKLEAGRTYIERCVDHGFRPA
jgi:hypothetical protein